MKRKIALLLLIAVIIGIVIGIWSYPDSSEASDSPPLTPHQERVMLLLNRMIKNDPVERHIVRLLVSPEKMSRTSIILKKKAEDPESLRSEFRTIRDNAPDWEISIASDLDHSSMSFDKFTYSKLIEQEHTSNDPDIYLHLMYTLKFSALDTYQPSQLRLFRSWLDKANGLKKPGVPYLLEIIDRLEKNPPRKLGENETLADVIGNLSIIPGYDEFTSMLKKGDYLLFRTLLTLGEPGHDSSLTKYIKAGLKDRISKGDKEALTDLAKMEFEYYFKNSRLEDIVSKERSRPRHQIILLLSKLLEGHISIRTETGTSETFNRFHELSEQIRMEARRGNRKAMYLWLKYGSLLYQPYTPDVFRDIYDFSDTLIQTGNTKFLLDIKIASKLLKEEKVYRIPTCILFLSYSEESCSRVVQEADAYYDKH